MSDQNFNRIKIILAEKNLPNKYLADKLGRDLTRNVTAGKIFVTAFLDFKTFK